MKPFGLLIRLSDLQLYAGDQDSARMTIEVVLARRHGDVGYGS
jgi:hypothetical protein